MLDADPEQKFYRHTFAVTIISRDPVVDADLEYILNRCDGDDLLTDVSLIVTTECTHDQVERDLSDSGEEDDYFSLFPREPEYNSLGVPTGYKTDEEE